MRLGADPAVARQALLQLVDRLEAVGFRLSRESDHFGKSALHLKETPNELSEVDKDLVRHLSVVHPPFNRQQLRTAIHTLLPRRALVFPPPHPKSHLPESLRTPYGYGVDDLLRRSPTARDLYHDLTDRGLTFRSGTIEMQFNPVRKTIVMSELNPPHRRYQTAILLEEMIHLHHIDERVVAHAILSGDNPVRQLALLFQTSEGVTAVQRHMIREEILEGGGPPVYDLSRNDPIVGGYRDVLQKMDAGGIDHGTAAVEIAEIRQREIASADGFNYHESYFRKAQDFVDREAVQQFLARFRWGQ